MGARPAQVDRRHHPGAEPRAGCLADRPPPPLPGPAWQHALSTATHALFYFPIGAIPLTGWWFSSAVPERHAISFGFFTIPFVLTRQGFDLVGPLVVTHPWMAYNPIALLALHVTAVIK